MSIRTERVAGEVLQAIAQLLQTEFSHISDALLTVTKVRMSPDLKSGRAYLSILGGSQRPDAILEAVQYAAPQIRSMIGKKVRLRYTPEIFYYLDDTQQEVARVEEIFRKIHENDKPVPKDIKDYEGGDD